MTGVCPLEGNREPCSSHAHLAAEKQIHPPLSCQAAEASCLLLLRRPGESAPWKSCRSRREEPAARASRSARAERAAAPPHLAHCWRQKFGAGQVGAVEWRQVAAWERRLEGSGCGVAAAASGA